MPNSSKKNILFLAVIMVFFLYGVTKLLTLRFEEGDVYPAYSSLRYDPLGTRALYEGLESILGDSVTRNYDSLSRLAQEEDTTLMYLGVGVNDRIFYCKKPGKAIKHFAATGGRVVISFRPVTKTLTIEDNGVSGVSPSDAHRDEKAKDKTPAKVKDCKKTRSKDDASVEKGDCEENSQALWGMSFGYENRRIISGDAQFVASSLKELRLPAVSWHTTLFFKNLSREWKVVYATDTHPVVIEKKLGRGSVVLSADTYFFSNEALIKERRPKLLSWVIGDRKKVIFDESHLGIQKNLGIATLGRKYNLHWIFFGLLLFGSLFVWKNSSYFVPPVERLQDDDVNDTGPLKDYKEGLISLLRRNIPANQVLRICVEMWQKTVSGDRGRPPENMETLSKVKTIVESERQRPGRHRNPVNAYRKICNILSKRKIL